MIKKPTGYVYPVKNGVPQVSPMLVGCKKCKTTWYEDCPYIGARRNSALLCYDYCSECKTETDEKTTIIRPIITSA